MEQTNNAPQTKQETVAQPPQRPPSSHSSRQKDEITPKIGKKERYKDYENIPFSSYEKSNLYQQDYINSRVEQRMRMQEKVADEMDQGISNKDKFITRKGQEPFYFHGNRENFFIKKAKEKYDQIQKKNEGYKLTKEQEDKYYKSYVDNAKPTSLEQIDKELYENEGKKINRQKQYNTALNEQVSNNRAMKNRFEKDYNQRLDDLKKIEEEKYQKRKKCEEDKKIKNLTDVYNVNQNLINAKKEAQKHIKEQNLEFDNQLNDKVRKQINFMEEKEYRKKEDKKIRYKEALDKQVHQQKIRRKREKDIENGNF